ncbi:AraC family transcriptional regulator [Streptomyces sp. ISL-98]|uniref:AraC family transcriptional regulator n=1 Tax=Streptomyces sp. ISL-98 TaxID=2819192 RepID=UPI0027E533E6|nr:AraC family transcriptional regulator [Streptomyces sp. ISL-98]
MGSSVETFCTADLDEARVVIGEKFYANSIERLDREGAFAAKFRIIQLGALTVGELQCGADVRMRFGELGAYHVDIPLEGRLSWHQGTRAGATATPEEGAVFQPSGDTFLDRWSGDCRLLAVKIDASALEGQLAHALGRAPRGPVAFAHRLDVSQGAGRSWGRLVRWAAREASEAGSLVREPLVAKPLEEALLNGLLLAVDHPYREELTRPTAATLRPAPVKRVVDAIHDSPEHPYSAAELAALARVSVRWLQEAFRRYVGMSPMAYLRGVRLDRVRDELKRCGPGELTVSEAAFRWGFAHLGRFSGAYRARFGEAPSETLRSG